MTRDPALPPRLSRRFFRRDAAALARSLLGRTLVRRLDGLELAGRIVEVEAYLGVEDRAAHSFGGRRTERNLSMWLDGGFSYVYFTYGMHWCFNVVAAREGVPEACLIRAVEPLAGLEEMRRRRAGRIAPGRLRDVDLCSGPAKLCQAFGIDGALDRVDLVTSERLYLGPGRPVGASRIVSEPRVGIGYAREWAAKPLRFYEASSPHVSRAPRRSRAPR